MIEKILTRKVQMQQIYRKILVFIFGEKMNIAILGAGNIGGTLGGKWSTAGHESQFGVRDANSSKTLSALRQAGARRQCLLQKPSHLRRLSSFRLRGKLSLNWRLPTQRIWMVRSLWMRPIILRDRSSTTCLR